MKSGISINNIGGYHPDPTLSKWPAGSIFEITYLNLNPGVIGKFRV